MRWVGAGVNPERGGQGQDKSQTGRSRLGKLPSLIDSILYNHTWELVNIPASSKPLSSKCQFKRKRKVDRSIVQSKSCDQRLQKN